MAVRQTKAKARPKSATTAEEIIKEKEAKAKAKKEEAEKLAKEEEKALDEAKAKVEKAKADKKNMVKVEVCKGFGKEFGTDKIQDGTILTLPKINAIPLVKKGFVKLK